MDGRRYANWTSRKPKFPSILSFADPRACIRPQGISSNVFISAHCKFKPNAQEETASVIRNWQVAWQGRGAARSNRSLDRVGGPSVRPSLRDPLLLATRRDRLPPNQKCCPRRNRSGSAATATTTQCEVYAGERARRPASTVSKASPIPASRG